MSDGIILTIDDHQARGLFKRLLDAGQGPKVTKPLAEAMLSDTLDTFDAQGRPEKWKELSPATLAKKGRGADAKILQDSGVLINRIAPGWSDNEAWIGLDLAYAAIHQFGGMAGRGHKVKIPARPYLVETETMVAECVATMEEALEGAVQ